MESVLLDIAGHRRSPATLPGYHRGRPPRNKGEQYPADPPTVEEIVGVMRTVGERYDGHRLRALVCGAWRAGLRINAALSLQESDLDRTRGAVLVRRPPRHIPPFMLRLMANSIGYVKPELGRQARAALAMDRTDLTFDPTRLPQLYPALPCTALADVLARNGTERTA
jgi:integrase